MKNTNKSAHARMNAHTLCHRCQNKTILTLGVIEVKMRSILTLAVCSLSCDTPTAVLRSHVGPYRRPRCCRRVGTHLRMCTHCTTSQRTATATHIFSRWSRLTTHCSYTSWSVWCHYLHMQMCS